MLMSMHPIFEALCSKINLAYIWINKLLEYLPSKSGHLLWTFRRNMKMIEIPFNEFIGEAARRGLKGKVLISVQIYHSPISYIHKVTLARHVGDAKSLHQCCKKEVLFSNGEFM